MIIDIFKHAMMITGFVLMMMLLIEYINVQTRGAWQTGLKKSRFGQYILGAFLGAIPGCLGAFTVVSLYSHRMVSFGALAAAMIATSGDEAFVMLAMFPVDALWLSAVLFAVALIAGYLSDIIFKNKKGFLHPGVHEFEVHEEDQCRCFSKKDILPQLKALAFSRAFLIALLGLFLAALLWGQLGPDVWNWKKITFVFGTLFSLFIVISVPDHFLEKHLYEHVVKKHIVRIFLWTFGALLAVHFMETYIHAEEWLKDNTVIVLIMATLLGIIPESGPHLVFTTMYAEGLIPFAVLLASSISQDGHGTLPLLAVSTRAFLWLQVVAVVTGVVVGMLFLLLGQL